jgi:hypothetical protein
MTPQRAAYTRSSASPAGFSRYAVRQSGRCRAADSGSDEQGEPQQQLKQVTEDVKQQAEEATQGVRCSGRSFLPGWVDALSDVMVDTLLSLAFLHRAAPLLCLT